MNIQCERAVELLTRSPDCGNAEERRLAADHASACVDCRGAIDAVNALRRERLVPVPPVREGALARALVAATRQAPSRERRPRTFWHGAVAGAALAAGIAIAVVSFTPALRPAATSATPQITLAVAERRNVNISLEAPEPFADAEIHVLLSGAIELSGFEGQQELRWRTSLERGTNQLTLPLVATGSGGGQVLVEVVHHDKRRAFVVDVRSPG